MTPAAILAGPDAHEAGATLGQLTGLPVVNARARTFPDGEVCVISPVRAAAKLFIVQGLHPPQDRRLQELYQMVDAARRLGCRDIICLTPYLAYARQDRCSRAGEPVSGEIVLRTLAALGAQTLVTIEVHNPKLFEQAHIKAFSLSADSLFEGWIASTLLRDPLLVAPDAGGLSRVERLSERLGVPFLALEKVKAGDGATSYSAPLPDLSWRDVVMIDDLCSSGSTLIPLAKHLLAAGAGGLFYAAVHFFADPVRIAEGIGRPITIAASDTIPGPVSAMSVFPLLAQWIRNELGEYDR